MLDRHDCFSVFHHLQKDKQRKQRHSLKLGKKRRESSKRNYYIISPRVMIKAIIINTDDQLVLHWAVCLSFLKQILAHQNFSRVCTTYLLRHFRPSPDRLRLLRQSNRGRKRLHTLNLELIQHHPCTETRTSLYTQPFFSCPHGHNSRPSHLQPSQTQPLPPRQASPFTSRLGKRPSLVFSNADSNKKKQKQSSLSFPSTRPLHGITLNIRGMTPERTSTSLRPSTLSS